MPRYVDVDEQAQEGAIVYRIGGKQWYAAEPSLDSFKEVLAQAPDAATVAAAGAADAPQPTREETNKSLDSMLPQLRLLLQGWDEATQQPTDERPSHEFLAANLSVKRAGNILREVLGEGQGAAAA